MGIHIFYGDEPYSLAFQRKMFEGKVSQEINLNIFDKWSEQVVPFVKTMPFFDNCRVAIVSCNTLSEVSLSEKEITDLIADDLAELVIFPDTVDKRSKVYKLLSDKKAIMECNKLTDVEKVKRLLLKEVSKRGGRITEDALSLFIQRENYPDCDDVTLFNLFSDLDRLLAFDLDITAESVKKLIKENVSEEVFGIAKMIQAHDAVGLSKQAAVASKPIGTLSALLREYRIAYKAKYFPVKDIGVKYAGLSSFSKEELVHGIEVITDAIAGIKNGSMPEKNALEYCFWKLIYKEVA